MKDNGGSAFPGFGEPAPAPRQHGMSLRDWFAGQALAGQAAFEGMEGCSPRDWAAMTYEVADAMLAEREKP